MDIYGRGRLELDYGISGDSIDTHSVKIGGLTNITCGMKG